MQQNRATLGSDPTQLQDIRWKAAESIRCFSWTAPEADVMTTPAEKAFVGWLHEWRTSCFTAAAEEVRITRQNSWKQWSGATTWAIGITAGYARPLAECLRQRSAADITRIRRANRRPQWNKFLSEMCKAILTISFFCRFAVNAEKFRGFVGKSAFRVLQIHLICDILYKIMGIFMNKSTL